MQRPELTLQDQLAKGYTPSQVEWLVLHSLHQQFDFIQVLHEPAGLAQPSLTTFQFKRPDGSVLNYCPSVIDIYKSREAPGHPDLRDWLSYLKRQLQQRHINPQDLVLAPLLQVQLGRHHFNTIAIYVLPQNQFRVLIIEPRDNNFTLRLRNYPIDGLKKIISAQLGEGVMFTNITIGQQSLTDDVTCGKHQINYSEILGGLPQPFFQDPERLVRLLKRTSMVRRYLDAERFLALRAHFQLGEESWDELLAKQATQRFFQQQYHRVQHLVPTWNAAFENLQQYIDESRLEFGLFKKHTRQLTGVALKELLDRLTTSGIGEEWRQETYYKLIELIFAFYASISSPQSQLRLKLEAMLICLLNVRDVHEAVLKKHANPADRARLLEAYFFDCLAQLRTRFAINPDKLNAIYAATLAINKLDIGMTKKHEKIDAKRALQFARLSEALATLLVLPQKGLRQE